MGATIFGIQGHLSRQQQLWLPKSNRSVRRDSWPLWSLAPRRIASVPNFTAIRSATWSSERCFSRSGWSNIEEPPNLADSSVLLFYFPDKRLDLGRAVDW